MPLIHYRLGTRSEGVAFLCRNWDKKRKQLANDTHLTGPVRLALKRSTDEEEKVTCPACLKARR